MSWNPLSYLPVVGSYFTPAAAGEQPGAPAPAAKSAAAAPAPAGASVSTGEEGKKAGCCSRISACFSACRPSACCARLPSCNLDLKGRCGRFWGSIGSGLSSCGSSLKAMSCGLISARTGYIALGVAGAGVLGKVGMDYIGARNLMDTLNEKSLAVYNANPDLHSTALTAGSFSLSDPAGTAVRMTEWIQHNQQLAAELQLAKRQIADLQAETGAAREATDAVRDAAKLQIEPLVKRDGACSILETQVIDGLHQQIAILKNGKEACEKREAKASEKWSIFS